MATLEAKDMELVEKVDLKDLQCIRDNFNILYDSGKLGRFVDTKNGYTTIQDKQTVFTMLNDFYENRKHNEKQKYKYVTGISWGRMFTSSYSLQSMSKLIRHTISKDLYWDLDIVNAHPTILYKYCLDNNLNIPKLTQYITNRDEMLNDITKLVDNDGVSVSRDEAKTIPLAIINGGKRTTLFTPDAMPDWIKLFETEIVMISDFFCKSDIGKPFHRRAQGKKEYNVKGSALNYYLCEQENIILVNMYRYLLSVGYKVGVFCFDGLMVYKKINDGKSLPFEVKHLRLMETSIKEDLGYDLKIMVKPMSDGINLEGLEVKPTADIALVDLIEGGNVEVANLFYRLCKDKFVYTAETWYGITPIGRWKQLDGKNSGLINAFCECVVPEVKKYEESINDKDTMGLYTKFMKSLKSVKFQTDCVKYSANYFNKPDLKFDNKPYCVGFNNGVWDFSKDVKAFRNYKPEDYMTMSVGYDWNEEDATNPEKNGILNNLLMQILGDVDTYNVFMGSLARCLIGINSQKFVILNGQGRNGKGVICDGLGSITFGDYAYNMSTSVITEARSGGANTNLALCDKKRFIYCKEPSGKKKIDNSIVKELTGGGLINARQCFSNKTDCNLCGTLFMETNPKLNWVEEPSNAEIGRVIFTAFKSIYVEDSEEVDEDNRIYLMNTDYTTPEWKEEYAIIYFNILKNILLKTDVNLKVVIPKSIQIQSKAYLSQGIQILDYIKENFKILDGAEKKHQLLTGEDVMSLNDFTQRFRTSTYFDFLQRDEKAGIKKSLEELFETNAFVKKFYMERFRRGETEIKKAIIGLGKIVVEKEIEVSTDINDNLE